MLQEATSLKNARRPYMELEWHFRGSCLRIDFLSLMLSKLGCEIILEAFIYDLPTYEHY